MSKKKYYKTLVTAIKNAPKGSIILYDELDNKIMINPSKFDFLKSFSRSRNYFKKKQ